MLPFGADPEFLSLAHPLFTQLDAIGRSQMIVRVAREPFLKAHHAEMVDFMEDYLRTLRYLLDPAHRAEAVALLSQVTKQKPALFEAWAFTDKDYYRDPKGVPDLGALQANIDLQHQLGFLRTSLEVKKYADFSIAEEAAKRLASSTPAYRLATRQTTRGQGTRCADPRDGVVLQAGPDRARLVRGRPGFLQVGRRSAEGSRSRLTNVPGFAVAVSLTR